MCFNAWKHFTKVFRFAEAITELLTHKSRQILFPFNLRLHRAILFRLSDVSQRNFYWDEFDTQNNSLSDLHESNRGQTSAKFSSKKQEQHDLHFSRHSGWSASWVTGKIFYNSLPFEILHHQPSTSPVWDENRITCKR